jgi:RimJ/RimL family protein N-acetyltransferase
MLYHRSDDTHFQLTGQLTTLRPFTHSNITSDYIGWLNNPAVVRYSNQRFLAHNVETCEAYLRSFIQTDNMFLAIYRESDFVGTMTAYVSQAHKTADMGIMVGCQSWGQGIGTDAWTTLMRYLFQTGSRKVTGGTLRCNTAMVNIMMKSGMKPDGVRFAQELVNGQPEDILYFAKFNT